MSLSASFGHESDNHATPAVMRAATAAYDRTHRLKLLALAALGAGGVALTAATASGLAAFLLGRRLRPSRLRLDRLRLSRLQRA